MAFRAVSIDAVVVEHPLVEHRIIRSAAGLHDRSRFLLVTARNADGVCGWGEAATTAQWNGETADSAKSVVDRCLAPAVLGATFDHPREAMVRMDAVCFGMSFAKSAVDTALWDLWCRADGVRVVDRAGDREARTRIPTRASIGANSPQETLRLACEFCDAGIRTLKFKVGVPGFDDVARLRMVREALGDAPIFTIDANGGYASAREAIAAVRALEPYGIQLAEQPTPRERLAMLAEVRRNVSVPILVDEGVFSPGQLDEALDLGAFDYLSLYPGKNGGFTRSLEMAKRARSAGKPCVIGSNLETDIGQAAMVALAACSATFPVEELACDLPAAVFYERSSLKVPLGFSAGCVEVPSGPGFGVEPLPECSEKGRCP